MDTQYKINSLLYYIVNFYQILSSPKVYVLIYILRVSKIRALFFLIIRLTHDNLKIFNLSKRNKKVKKKKGGGESPSKEYAFVHLSILAIHLCVILQK